MAKILSLAPTHSVYTSTGPVFFNRTQWTTIFCAILFFFSYTKDCPGQDAECRQSLITEIDSVAKEKIIRARNNIIISDNGGKTGFAIFGAYEKETIILSIKTVGAGGCVNEGDSIHFVFSDSSKLKLTNMDKFNCQAKSSLYFNIGLNNIDQLEILSNKQIAKLTVWTKQKFLVRTFNSEMATNVRQLISCLYSNWSGTIFVVVERQPEYTGGLGAMLDFLKKNMRIPKAFKKREALGTVHVQFVIALDGSVTDVKTVKSVHPDLDQEAERLVKMMPPWRPGMQNGKPVYVKFILPVKFH